MHIFAVQRILGLLLMVFSITMVPPALVSLHYADGQLNPFLSAFAITLAAGILLWLSSRHRVQELRLRDGFIVTALFWIGLTLFAAIPLLLAGEPALSITDAFFETTAGLTTTGATTLVGLDTLPRSILYYRAQLQWFGGMGIIVLAVAVLPMLGIGGMQLYRAEMPGPLKDTKLTPRITETAKALWLIYAGLTVICSTAYWLAGMTPFDAICHGMTTIATGGFSTHDDSIGWFDSRLIELICIAGMSISAINYSLHFAAWRGLQLGNYRRDAELRIFVRVLSVLIIAVVAVLALSGYHGDASESARHGLFQAVSILTTSGFTTESFAPWPGVLPVLLILVSFIGGCGGSTAGGMKVIRWLLIYNQGVREIRRLIHPHSEIPVRLGSAVVPQRVIDAVWGFCVAYIILFGMMLVVLVSLGMDQVSAFAALASSMNNLGPAIGEAASSYTTVSAPAKWVCMAAMFLGRLEVFTLLVLFSPTFWRS